MARARREASAARSPREPAAAGAEAPAFSALAAPFSRLIDAGGRIEIAEVADSFGMSKSQLAETIGLGRETLYKAARAEAARTQSRVREMLEIIGRISAWAGGKEQAMAWYRESLVKSGQAGPLRDYLDHIAMGGFA
jgi:hypothetical protein